MRAAVAFDPVMKHTDNLIRLLATGEHHSCLLLTSRERPQDLAHLEEDTPAVRFLSLAGLPTDAGRQMLEERGVGGDSAALADLVQHYSGNPLALKLTAETVDSLFDGNISAFLQADARIFDDIRDVLDQQFARLTPLERELMVWLAIVREPISYTALARSAGQAARPAPGAGSDVLSPETLSCWENMNMVSGCKMWCWNTPQTCSWKTSGASWWMAG